MFCSSLAGLVATLVALGAGRGAVQLCCPWHPQANTKSFPTGLREKNNNNEKTVQTSSFSANEWSHCGASRRASRRASKSGGAAWDNPPGCGPAMHRFGDLIFVLTPPTSVSSSAAGVVSPPQRGRQSLQCFRLLSALPISNAAFK